MVKKIFVIFVSYIISLVATVFIITKCLNLSGEETFEWIKFLSVSLAVLVGFLTLTNQFDSLKREQDKFNKIYKLNILSFLLGNYNNVMLGSDTKNIFVDKIRTEVYPDKAEAYYELYTEYKKLKD